MNTVTKTTKKFLAVMLSLLMIASAIPFVSIAAEPGTLTIKADVSSDGIEIDDDISFEYEVKINDELYNGKAVGDDGKTYNVSDGKVTIPYNVNVTIENIAAGSSYSVKRLGYDNEKYALVGESEPLTGKVAQNEYFVSVNGSAEEAITAEEFENGTESGTKLEYSVYKDAAGNSYTEEEIGYRGGYTGANDSTTGNYAHALNSLEQKTVTINVNYGKVSTTSSGSGLKKTYTSKAPASYVISCDGFESASGSVEGSATAPLKANESLAKSNAGIELAVVFTEYLEQVFNTVENETGKKVVYDSTGKLIITKGGYYFGDFSFSDNAAEQNSVTISAFTLTEDIRTYAYRAVYGEADKTAAFDVKLTPAPTGTFQINFALDDTVPTGYEDAVFEIKDVNGKVLSEGADYKLEKSPFSLEDITKGVLKWGISIYTFSGLKAGTYSVSQKKTANGYKLDSEAVYPFTVERADGAVKGENFDTSAINSKIPCLYNADKSINILVTKIKLFLFMNESFTLDFNVKDQNKEPVNGSQFMMLERDALISLVGQLGSLGVKGIGNIDISKIIESFGGLDFSNIDAGTVLAILNAVLDIIPDLPEGTKLTIPAILTASSNENGMVKFNNASNMMNVLDTIAKLGDTVDAENIAETIKNLLGSAVPENYLDTLVKLAKYMGVLDVHTGIPSAYFVLFNNAAPNGYERNGVIYTIKVGTDGNATTSAGVLIPVIADVISERLNIDIYDILINEEEFNNASETIKNAFGTFTNYAEVVIDTVCDFVESDLGGIIPKERFEELKDNISNLYEKYDDLSLAIGEAVKDFNESIKSDLTEDWTYTNNRYFLSVGVTSEDCKGNAVAVTVKDSAGEQWSIEQGKASLPYGTYTFALASEGNYALADGSSSYTLVIDDHNAKYSVTYKYHISSVLERVEPTCTKTGLTEGASCALCDTVLTAQQVIKELGHTVEIDAAIAPTCTESGLTEGSHCTVCKETLVPQETVKALGHTEVPIGEFILPTCTEDGITDGIKCEVCGEIIEAREVLDNTGHMLAGDIDSIVKATCTQGGKEADFVCWKCGEVIVVGAPTEALGHVPETDEAVAPTCTETGLTEGSHCAVCKEVLVPQETVEALGHKETIIDKAIEPTCTKDGITAGVKCSVCDEILEAQEVIEKLGHSYERVVEAPTIDKDGAVLNVCSRCGKKQLLEVIPALIDEDAVACENQISGFCEVFNRFYGIPVLSQIFSIVHAIVHYFHFA